MLIRTVSILVLCGYLLLSGCQSVAPAVLSAESANQAPTTPGPDQGSIRISKYPDNFTAFKIELQNGPTIITDPYNMDEEIHADIVTESHSHSDHTDVSHILEPYELLNHPGNFEFAGVKITGISGMHNKTSVNPSVSPYGVFEKNMIYVFELGNIRLAQFASQGELPSSAMFAQIGQVDVLILQVFSKADKLNISEACEIAQQLSARIIIPAHGNPSLNHQFAEQLGADFQEEPTGILELSESDLDQLKTPIVVVLDH